MAVQRHRCILSKAKFRKQGAEELGAQQLTSAAQLVLTAVTGNIPVGGGL